MTFGLYPSLVFCRLLTIKPRHQIPSAVLLISVNKQLPVNAKIAYSILTQESCTLMAVSKEHYVALLQNDDSTNAMLDGFQEGESHVLPVNKPRRYNITTIMLSITILLLLTIVIGQNVALSRSKQPSLSMSTTSSVQSDSLG